MGTWREMIEEYLDHCIEFHEHNNDEDIRTCLRSSMEDDLCMVELTEEDGDWEYKWEDAAEPDSVV